MYVPDLCRLEICVIGKYLVFLYFNYAITCRDETLEIVKPPRAVGVGLPKCAALPWGGGPRKRLESD